MTTEQLPHWDLSNIYPGFESEAFQNALAELKSQIAALTKYADDHHIGSATSLNGANLGDTIGGFLDCMNTTLNLYATLRVYVYSFVSTDSFNATAKRLLSEIQILNVPIEQVNVRFQKWLGARAETLPAMLAQNESARVHAFFLKETMEQSRYLMSEAEEALASELDLSGATAWGKLQGTICSQLTVGFERNGKVEKLPMPALINLGTDPDESVRRRAYEAEHATWESVKEPLAACLNGVKGAAATLNQRRGRTDALHEPLDQSRIDRTTLDAMLGAMRDSFPAFRRYWRAKAKRLGKDVLAWWDVQAPVTVRAEDGAPRERRLSWAEAESFIVDNFRAFSPGLADFAARAFRHNWMDAEPRAGKRGGAFCMGVPGVGESRILLNFDGSLDRTFTVAHELGHGFHNECLHRAGKTMLQRNSPMTLNETASIFCETLVTDAAITQATSDDERLAILETSLLGSAQIVVDIYSRFLFEKEVFERRAQAELSAEDFCDIMLRAQAETYGDALHPDYRHKYMWTWKPHYYRPELSFYNYPYTFGLLFGLGLYAIYRQRGAAFVPDYEALLASTGEASAADLAARFGINIREKQFWAESLRVIEADIERYCAL
ncbi:MAG: M3 family oligoendopeptidase [Anaerolineales bacterium]